VRLRPYLLDADCGIITSSNPGGLVVEVVEDTSAAG
jgi:hypothetical protein